MSEHPSYLELDRAALGAEAASARAHLARCERCRHYVERLARHEPRPPAWVRELAPSRSPRRAWWFGGSFALVAAAAVAVVLLVFVRRDREPSYTTVKGAPSIAVHVKRGDDVFIWDGVERLMPGDRLRLEVAARDHRRVQVLTAGDVSLFDAPLPAGGSLLLPAAWEVDAQPGAETLTVVLTDARGGTWRTTLTLAKQIEGSDR
jgi:hypothetical protein